MTAAPAKPPASAPERAFRLRGLVIDPRIGEMAGPGGREQVDPKVMAVMRVLAAHAGDLVTRDQLLLQVWSNVPVTDDAVSRCIYQLRSHLARASGDPAARKLIETLPKRGYRLTMPVEPVASAPATAGPAALGRHRRVLRWRPVALIAILAFTAVSAITVSTRVGAPLASLLLQGETSHNLQAREQYLKGRHFYDRRADRDLERAERHFRAAVEIDPDHARAWAGLAAIYFHRSVQDLDSGDYARMRHAVERALAADPEDSEVQFRAARAYQFLGDREQADHHWARAIELGADDPLILSAAAGDLLDAGRWEEAIALQRRAINLDPLAPIYRYNLAFMLLGSGDAQAARTALVELQEIAPSAVRPYDRALVAVANGRNHEALAIMDGAPGMDTLERNHILALAGRAVDRSVEAEQALAALVADASWLSKLQAADVYANAGRFDEAFRMLDSAHNAARTDNAVSTCLLKARALGLLYAHKMRADRRFDAWLARVDASSRDRPRLASTWLEPRVDDLRCRRTRVSDLSSSLDSPMSDSLPDQLLKIGVATEKQA
ncbi:MAG TPA: winged helix-turn-helix domain-containing protein, partial [Steroidobacteraceae bacterium]|nr:winged helix-turn-helix domain-containing protein [Steroidobacteraceae bacterium]